MIMPYTLGAGQPSPVSLLPGAMQRASGMAPVPSPSHTLPRLCIDHSRTDVFVSQEFLHRPNIIAIFYQMRGAHAKAADGVGIAIGGHSDPRLGGPHIHSGGVRMDNLEGRGARGRSRMGDRVLAWRPPSLHKTEHRKTGHPCEAAGAGEARCQR